VRSVASGPQLLKPPCVAPTGERGLEGEVRAPLRQKAETIQHHPRRRNRGFLGAIGGQSGGNGVRIHELTDGKGTSEQPSCTGSLPCTVGSPQCNDERNSHDC
jgi:hypothetical protein